MSAKTIVFQMNNTDNSYELAVLADQLGPELGALHANGDLRPKVPLPLDWARESRREKAPRAAFGAAHCNDPELLTEIVTADRRVSVQDALARNPYLSDVQFRLLHARIETPWRQRSLEATRKAVLEELKKSRSPKKRRARRATTGQLQTFITNDATYNLNDNYGFNNQKFTTVLHRVRALSATFPDAPTLLLGAAASRKQPRFAADYLHNYFIAPTPYDDVWSLVVPSPAEVLALYKTKERRELVREVVLAALYAKETRRRFDAGALEHLMATTHSAASVPGFTTRGSTPHDLFDTQAIELLARTPEWFELLRYQAVSDEQFYALCGTSTTHNLFTLLAARPHRLEHLLSVLPETAAVDRPQWHYAIQCVSQATPQLLDDLIVRTAKDQLLRVLNTTAYMPSSPSTLRLSPEALTTITTHHPDLLNAVADYVNRISYSLSEDAIVALLLDLPGFAYAVLNDHRYSTFIYETLVETGTHLAEAVNYLEEHCTESLSTVCTQLVGAP